MCIDKPVPHKHAALIKAWADGAKIEYKETTGFGFMPVNRPIWDGPGEYRIKPKPKVKTYKLVVKNNESGKYDITTMSYTSIDTYNTGPGARAWTAIAVIEDSMKEIEQ